MSRRKYECALLQGQSRGWWAHDVHQEREAGLQMRYLHWINVETLQDMRVVRPLDDVSLRWHWVTYLPEDGFLFDDGNHSLVVVE